MSSKGCLYHIVRVQELDSEIPPIESVPVVSEFLEVFPNDLPGIPPIWEVDFGMNFLPKMNPISIPTSWMAPSKLKELKDQLKDLLDKGFIRPSISPWGAPFSFVNKKDGSLECVLITANSIKSLLRTSILSLRLTICLINSKE